jgi:hypothetical protein
MSSQNITAATVHASSGEQRIHPGEWAGLAAFNSCEPWHAQDQMTQSSTRIPVELYSTPNCALLGNERENSENDESD